MARPSRPWFRFYVEAVSDRKLRRLTPTQRWLWVATLAAARQSPITGALMLSEREPLTYADLADLADVPAKEVARTFPLYEKAGMVEWDTDLDAWIIPKWSDRQFESDDVAARTRRHRSNHPDGNVPKPPEPRSRERGKAHTAPFPGTPPETETETDTEKVKSKPPHPPAQSVALALVRATSPAPQTAQSDSSFAEFWNQYPHKTDKPAAQRAWRKLNPVDHAHILAGLDNWKTHWQRTGTTANFIPYPATWLNGKRWKDSPPPAVATHQDVVSQVVRDVYNHLGAS